MRCRVVVLVVTLLAVGCDGGSWTFRGYEVRYQLREFSIFSGYRLRPEYVPLVARLIRTAEVPSYFRSDDYVSATADLQLPSYGTRTMVRQAADRAQITLFCIEIPEIGRDRCFALRKFGNTPLEKVDDFIVNTQRFAIVNLNATSSSIAYLGPKHQRFFVRPILRPAGPRPN